MVQDFLDSMIDIGDRGAAIKENIASCTELNAVNYGLSKLLAVVFELRIDEFAFVGGSNPELLFVVDVNGCDELNGIERRGSIRYRLSGLTSRVVLFVEQFIYLLFKERSRANL